MEVASLLSEQTTEAALLWRGGVLVSKAEAQVHVRAVGHASVSAAFAGIKAYWNVDSQPVVHFPLG